MVQALDTFESKGWGGGLGAVCGHRWRPIADGRRSDASRGSLRVRGIVFKFLKSCKLQNDFTAAIAGQARAGLADAASYYHNIIII